jgi:hypothetical protein
MGMEARQLLAGGEARSGEQRVAGDPAQPAPVRGLSPVERALVERYGAALQGRVLLVGGSLGHFTTQLYRVALELHGVCDGPADLARCRRAYPRAVFTRCDPRDLADFAPHAFDSVVVPGAALDLLDDDGRCAALGDMRGLLAQDGLLVFFSQSRDAAVRYGRRWRALLGSRGDVRDARRYLSRDAQERQLSELGYELLDCLDHDGRHVERSAGSERTRRLHYLARA